MRTASEENLKESGLLSSRDEDNKKVPPAASISHVE